MGLITARLIGYGFGPWLALAVTIAMVLYPAGRILRRMGLSPLLAIVAFIPPINVIALWILAFIGWPRCEPGDSENADAGARRESGSPRSSGECGKH